jgi:hypothetical protein
VASTMAVAIFSTFAATEANAAQGIQIISVIDTSTKEVVKRIPAGLACQCVTAVRLPRFRLAPPTQRVRKPYGVW